MEKITYIAYAIKTAAAYGKSSFTEKIIVLLYCNLVLIDGGCGVGGSL